MKLPFAVAMCLGFCQALLCQPVMPPWLSNYPGATAQTKTYAALVEVTYNAAATPEEVTDHYRKLFEARNLGFQPNSDGVGTIVRAAAAECNLMISIRAQAAGTMVKVSCASKTVASSGGWTPAGNSSLSGRTPPAGMPAAVYARHLQLAEEMGIGKERPDAEAPPLVWPDWLVDVRGARLAVRQGVEPWGAAYLQARYTTSIPMTQILTFYRDLLNANDFPVIGSSIGTGQTQTGIQQNALGHVAGTKYIDGSPGPSCEIAIQFSRTYLNGPITVDLKYTTYGYKAPRHSQ